MEYDDICNNIIREIIMCLKKVVGFILTIGGLGIITKSPIIGIIILIIGLLLLFDKSSS